MRKIFSNSIFTALLDLETLSPYDLDTVMSFIPEASFRMMSIGTPCIGNDGKTFCSLGFIQKGEEEKLAQRQSMFPQMTKENLMPYLSGLYYDSNNPGRQEVVKVRINEALPLLDFDPEKTEEAARKSCFMDAQALETMMEIVL